MCGGFCSIEVINYDFLIMCLIVWTEKCILQDGYITSKIMCLIIFYIILLLYNPAFYLHVQNKFEENKLSGFVDLVKLG